MPKKEKLILNPEYEESPMERRSFLLKAGAAGAVLGGVGYVAFAPESAPFSRKDFSGERSYSEPEPFRLQDFQVAKPPGMSHDFGIARMRDSSNNNAQRWSPEEQRRLLRAALDAVGGIEHFVQPGDVVLVKPDVSYDRSYTLGATSNPVMVGEMVRVLLEDAKAAEVRVADVPIEYARSCFEKTGIQEAAEAAGARVFLPDDRSFRILHTPGATLIEHCPVFARALEGVDKVIGMPAVKDHVLCKASIALKNWTGLVEGNTSRFDKQIHEYVSDLSLLMKPTLTIIDGTQVLFENGPTGGNISNVRFGNVVLAGTDQVAMDAWAFEHCLERGTDYPAYLGMAEQKGGGKVDWSGREMEVIV